MQCRLQVQTAVLCVCDFSMVDHVGIADLPGSVSRGNVQRMTKMLTKMSVSGNELCVQGLGQPDGIKDTQFPQHEL